MTATPEAVLMGGEDERAAQPGMGELLERLVGDARGLAYAEVDLFKTTYWLKLRGVLIWLGIALGGAVLCLAALAALLMGLVLGLAAIMGPFVAALVVGGGGAVLGAMIVIGASRRINRGITALSGTGEAGDDRDGE